MCHAMSSFCTVILYVDVDVVWTICYDLNSNLSHNKLLFKLIYSHTYSLSSACLFLFSPNGNIFIGCMNREIIYIMPRTNSNLSHNKLSEIYASNYRRLLARHHNKISELHRHRNTNSRHCKVQLQYRYITH